MSSSGVLDWATLPLSELIERKFTGPSPTCEERQIATTQEWGLLKTTAVAWSGWNENAHKVPPKPFWGNTSIEVHQDDVLITKAGPRQRVGVVVHVANTRPHLMVSGKMVGLRPKTCVIVPSLLARMLSSQPVQEYLNSRTTGMAESQTNFADEALLATRIRVPSLPEQRRIAEILDTLDEQIRSANQLIAKLLLAKEGQSEAFFSDMAASQHKQLDELVISDICYGIVQAGPFISGGVPVLMIRDLLGDFESGIHRTSVSIDKKYERSRTKPGDLLLSIKGTIGRVAVVPQHYAGNISRDMARIRFSSSVLPDYARQYLSSQIGNRKLDLAVVGTTRAEISIHTLKKLTIPVASPDRQREIVRILESYDSRIASIKLALGKLTSVKQGLMSDLLSGRVRVHESAEVAL